MAYGALFPPAPFSVAQYFAAAQHFCCLLLLQKKKNSVIRAPAGQRHVIIPNKQDKKETAPRIDTNPKTSHSRRTQNSHHTQDYMFSCSPVILPASAGCPS